MSGATATLRTPTPADLPGLSALCLRSKAHWGYDAAFMAACVPVLRMTPAGLTQGRCVMAEEGTTPLGVAKVVRDGADCDLDKLFIDPPAMGRGIGALLYRWCVAQAREIGARRLLIEADPGAAPFYMRMGAIQIGSAPSEAIAGRMLPLLAVDLTPL